MDFLQAIEGKTVEVQRTLIRQHISGIKAEIENGLAGKALDQLLYRLLKAMGLLFLVNRDYRENIRDFNGSYVIRSRDGKIDVTAVFGKIKVFSTEQDGLSVLDTAIENPTTTVTFKDPKAMADFLLSGSSDVIAGMLDNRLSVSGNLNYLFKFVYLLWLVPEILGINDLKTLLQQPA
jgi:hypothetical protein